VPDELGAEIETEVSGKCVDALRNRRDSGKEIARSRYGLRVKLPGTREARVAGSCGDKREAQLICESGA